MVYSSVAVVLPGRLADVWSACGPLIEAAIGTSPLRRSIEDIHDKILSGQLELVVCFDERQDVQAAMVIRYTPHGEGFIAHIQAAGGTGLSKARTEWAQLLDWLQRKQVTRVQLYCQAPQERLWRRMGFSTAYRVMWHELGKSNG